MRWKCPKSLWCGGVCMCVGKPNIETTRRLCVDKYWFVHAKMNQSNIQNYNGVFPDYKFDGYLLVVLCC